MSSETKLGSVDAAAAKSKSQPVTQQELHRLSVASLKNLKDVELDFKGSTLTALMGANGNGKTTVLHALACAFSPISGSTAGYKFPEFFKPTEDTRWDGSEFSITYSQRVGISLQPSLGQKYTKLSDRWSPKYDRRPIRHVEYLLIRDCVPEVELMTSSGHVHYAKGDRVTGADDEIREAAAQVLNRKYEKLHSVTYRNAKRGSIGVSSGELTYSALSMSSGEQRVFRILEAVHSAPKHGLVLIDEIDLFLHEDALKRLVEHLDQHCKKTKKQLIFTSHFPALAKLEKNLSIITLHRTTNKTVAWSGYSHEALRHITGNNDKPLTVYVEDDVSEAIISRCASDLGIRPYLKIIRFGAASNAYSVGAGLLLANHNCERLLIVTDGDVLRSTKEKKAQTDRVLTGTGDSQIAQRRTLTRMVRMYHARRGQNPEQKLHEIIVALDPSDMDAEEQHIVRAAKEVASVGDDHELLTKVIDWLGESREVCLTKIAKIASGQPEWNRLTLPIRKWLEAQKVGLNIHGPVM